MSTLQRQNTRRALLKQGVAATVTATLLETKLLASSQPRSLVYLFLVGGEDSNNLLVPLDGRLADYQRSRGELALSPEALLRVTARDTNLEYGFHPALASVADLFRLGAAAVVANVGDPRPPDFARSVHSYDRLHFLPDGVAEPAWLADANGGRNGASILARVLTGRAHNPLATPGAYVLNSRVAVHSRTPEIKEEMSVTPLVGFPDTSIGRHLAIVASRLASSGGAGEVFTILQGGYDTHLNQLEAQARAYAELNDAVDAFYGFLTAKGLTQHVTLATATEFNRTLASNGKGGSEHAWGGHRLVIGAAAVGGVVHGSLPSYRLGGSDDATGRGVWRPSMAEAHLDSALGSWVGYSVSALAAAGLPGVSSLRVVI